MNQSESVAGRLHRLEVEVYVSWYCDATTSMFHDCRGQRTKTTRGSGRTPSQVGSWRKPCRYFLYYKILRSRLRSQNVPCTSCDALSRTVITKLRFADIRALTKHVESCLTIRSGHCIVVVITLSVICTLWSIILRQRNMLGGFFFGVCSRWHS